MKNLWHSRLGVVMGLVVLALTMLMAGACERKGPTAEGGEGGNGNREAREEKPGRSGESQQELVMYCSADQGYFQPVIDEFEKKSGVKVRVLFDTEATKTFGLVQRLVNEKDAPKAQVFVCSEPMGMVRLERAGVLEGYTSASAESAWPDGGWPARLRGEGQTWYGFGVRERVLVYNTKYVKGEDVLRGLSGLTDGRWRGRVGIARPEFGTTRGHMAAILTSCPDDYATWVKELKGNDVRLYDGNASVVRAVGGGEIYLGLADRDDVYAGKANGWEIEMKRIGVGVGKECETANTERFGLLAHAVGIVKGSGGNAAARAFVDFVLTQSVDEMLSEGEAKTLRIFGEKTGIGEGEGMAKAKDVLDAQALADHAEEALRVFEKADEGK